MTLLYDISNSESNSEIARARASISPKLSPKNHKIPYKERSLTALELQLHRSRSALVHFERLRNFVRWGVDLNLFLQNSGVTIEDLQNPDVWFTPLQVQHLDKNYIYHTPFLRPHQEHFHDGALFIEEEPVSVKLGFLFLPLALILQRLSKANLQFNLEQKMTAHKINKTTYQIYQEPYPFYLENSLGYECHYAEGIMDSVLQLKGWRNRTIVHTVCSKRLENLFTLYYAKQKIPQLHRKPDGSVWLGSKLFGKREPFPKATYDLLPRSMQKKAKNTTVTRIQYDLILDNKLLFKKGECYDGVFCVSDLHWECQDFLREFMHRLSAIRTMSEKSHSTLPSEQAARLLSSILKTGISQEHQESLSQEIDSFVQSVSEAKTHLSPEILEQAKLQSQISQFSQSNFSSPKYVSTHLAHSQIAFNAQDKCLECNGTIIAKGNQSFIMHAIIKDFQLYKKVHFSLRDLRFNEAIPEAIRQNRGFDSSFQRLSERLDTCAFQPFAIKKKGHGHYCLVINGSFEYMERK
jgi:hypothetical protein